MAGSGSASWCRVRGGSLKGVKRAGRPRKSLLGAELFMQKVREGRDQIEAPPKNCTWFRMSGVCEGVGRLGPGHGMLFQLERQVT